MSNENWTKGPWTIVSLDSTRHESLICNNDGVDILKFSEFLFIDKANAHLIAAAPELYEALSIAVVDGPNGYTEWVSYAQEVLAKARGE